PNFRITTSQFPEAFGQDPVVNTSYMGDYDTAVADNNFFYCTWGDNRLSTSFHANQPDVRIVTVPTTLDVLLQLDTVTVSGGNGDGIVDTGETNNLTITIVNILTNTATSVSATLSSSTPGVDVLAASSAYPNVGGNAIATNTTPFVFAVSNSVNC